VTEALPKSDPLPTGAGGPARPNLPALGLALLLVFALVWLRVADLRRSERASIHLVAEHVAEDDENGRDGVQGHETKLTRSKNQGMALQRAAFGQRDLLPLYGSSELNKPIPDKASAFFQSYPTGFDVFPIGRAGTTSLIMLQKLAGVGREARGRKVAFLLSPGWFFIESIEGRFYEGNFSKHQASALIFGSEFSFALKQGAARRMLSHPLTLERTPLLRFAIERLAHGRAVDRWLYNLAAPLGWMQNVVFAIQDDYESTQSLSKESSGRLETAPHVAKALDWKDLLAKASEDTAPPDEHPFKANAAADAAFRETMGNSTEWTDFELLLEGVNELGVEPLIICIPPNGWYIEANGVSHETLELFEQRIHEMCHRDGVPVVAFEDHLEDRKFIIDHWDHLSVKGWMFVNQALDEFYHRGD
jgi:D-alanine transfer protein